MDILGNISKWFELLSVNPELNYYKQRGMNQQEAEKMVETKRLPSEPDEDVGDNERER